MLQLIHSVRCVHVPCVPVLCSTYHRLLHHLPPAHPHYSGHHILSPHPSPISPISPTSTLTRHIVTGTWWLGGDRGGRRAGFKKGNSAVCPHCGEPFKTIGAVMSELLDQINSTALHYTLYDTQYDFDMQMYIVHVHVHVHCICMLNYWVIFLCSFTSLIS